MNFRILILFVLLAITFSSCKKDHFTESYLRAGNAMVYSLDGNLLIAGYNYSSQTGFDGCLMKVTTDGNVVWSKTFGGSNTDGFYKLINTSDGGIVAVGFQSQFSYGKPDLYIVKTNGDGVVDWEYNNNSIVITQGYSITETPDKGFIACGYIQTDQGSDRDLFVIKVNSLGKEVWEKRYGTKTGAALSGAYDEAYAILPAADSGFYLTGSIAGNVSCCGKSFLMKISAKGDSLWTKSYIESIGYSMINTADNNILICGSAYSNGQDAYLIKVDTLGVKIWENTYGTTGYDYGTTVIQIPGGYAFTGISSKSSSTNQDVMLYNITENGTKNWAATYGGSEVEQGFGLVRNEDGGYCITGLSNTGGSYIFLNRVSSDGTARWQKNLN
ncbi:MAG: hypothetical protein HXX13_07175 [Bacteroidetes bacterium]|nr:hypothetical protein [Bacteroidota bacterium]